MTLKHILLAGVALAALSGTAYADDPIGKGLTMYMQMGGQSGDGATLARETGAKQAAAALGIDLKAQYSGWDPAVMISQFKDAVAANPSCIEIMGHPGSTAFHDLVKGAVDQGIVVTSGNAPLSDLQKEFGPKGFGYAGVDLYAGGALTANAMLAKGLKAGDQAVVYGVFDQAERGQSEKGLADTLEKAGLKVDRLQVSQEVNSDPTLAVPVLTGVLVAYAFKYAARVILRLTKLDRLSEEAGASKVLRMAALPSMTEVLLTIQMMIRPSNLVYRT